MACHAPTHKISELRHSYLPYYVNKFDMDHTRLEQPQKSFFASLSIFAPKKKKK